MTKTETTQTTTYVIERVSDHGYESNGNRYGRQAVEVGRTRIAERAEQIRAAAKAMIEAGFERLDLGPGDLRRETGAGRPALSIGDPLTRFNPPRRP